MICLRTGTHSLPLRIGEPDGDEVAHESGSFCRGQATFLGRGRFIQPGPTGALKVYRSMMTTKNHVAPTSYATRGTEASENQCLGAMSKSRAPVLALDARGQIVSWNAACERLVGMPSEDARGKTCTEVF